jgi:arylsulfatase A-like enzyme
MPRPSGERPNVIVFFTDQQRWDTAGVHGNPLDLTPNFDAMAREGAFFRHAFTCQPVCAPARSCLQTGQYATTTGVWRNGLALRHDSRTLAHAFGDAGYRTGYIGKWHLSQHEPVPKEDRGGYDYWLASNALEHTSFPYDCVTYDGDGNKVKLPGYRVDGLTDAAIRFVDARQAEPFFLFLSYLEPHHQNQIDDYPPPDGYRERYEGLAVPSDLAALGGSTRQHLAGYYGIVKRLDEALGRLRDALKSLDLSENTILVYTTDHGCHFKTRNAEYKRSCHEASIRIPLAMTGPGLSGGARVEDLVSLVDVPPTILDGAGLPPPDGVQGRSLMPLIRGDPSGWPDDVFVQISESQIGRAVRTRRWKYGVTAAGKGGTSAPASERYVEQYLYDLARDPYELNNLAGLASHARVAERMRERLTRRMVEAGEPAPTLDPAPPREGSGPPVPDEAVDA